MRKITLLIGVLCFALASCGGPKKAEETKTDECCESKPKCEMTEEQKAECEAFKVQWNDWEDLDDATKTELIAKAKACIDEKKAECKGEEHKCEGEHGKEHKCEKEHGEKHECKEGKEEMTKEECEAKKAECEAKKAEMEAKWEAFDTLTLDEQKELIDMKMHMMHKKHHHHHHHHDKECKEKDEVKEECKGEEK